MDIVGDTLYATDSYHGFIEYNLINNTKKTFYLKDKISGYELNDKSFSSIRQDPYNSNIVYLSVSTTKYNFEKVYLSFLEQEASGMLIAFNKKTSKLTIIEKNLAFSNGLEITNDKKLIILNELSNHRMLKFNLKEVNAFVTGKSNKLPDYEIFVQRLPGVADYITKHKNYVILSLVSFMTDNELILNRIIMPSIYLRKIVYRCLYLMSELLRFIRKFYSCTRLERMQKAFESGKVQTSILSFKSAIAIFDQETNDYVKLIHLSIGHVTDAAYNPSTGNLYFGSDGHKVVYKMKIDL